MKIQKQSLLWYCGLLFLIEESKAWARVPDFDKSPTAAFGIFFDIDDVMVAFSPINHQKIHTYDELLKCQ